MQKRVGACETVIYLADSAAQAARSALSVLPSSIEGSRPGVTQAKRSCSRESAVSMARLRSATPSLQSHMLKGESLIGR
jgi:hypothetical protein